MVGGGPGAAERAALAVVGVLLAQLASVWLAGNVPPPAGTASDVSSPLTRVPLTMAGWGFGFVVVWEVITWAVRGGHKVVPPASRADETEKLLSELLAQAEAKMAQEAAAQKPADSNPAEKPAAPPA